MLAVFKDQLMSNPQVLIMVMRYSPLPSALVDAIAKIITQASSDPQKMQEAEQMKQLTIQHLVADTNRLQSTAEMQNAKAGSSQATALYDIAMARHMMTDQSRQELPHAVDMENAQTDKVTAIAGAHKAIADADKSTAQAARERAGVGADVIKNHLDLQKSAHEAVKARTEALLASRGQELEHMQALHGMQQDRQQTALDGLNAHAGMLGAIGGFHRDLAAAHRDKVGAVVDARPEPTPAAK